MVKRRNGGTNKGRLRTIKVYDETYSELVRIGSVFQLELGEKVSFDFVIRKLIDNAPHTVVKIDAVDGTTKMVTTKEVSDSVKLS